MKKGIDTIFEKYPEWDHEKQEVYWVEQHIPPSDDPKLMELLYSDPIDAIKHSFGSFLDGTLTKPEFISDLDWSNHK